MGADRYEDPDCPEAKAGLDEADPQEEADVARCDTPLDRCEFRAGDLDGVGAQECEFTIMDELHEQMRVEPIRVIDDPEDGLPHPVTGATQFAPPFTHETMVCIEDTRQYVEVFTDEICTLVGWRFFVRNDRGEEHTLWRGEVGQTEEQAYARWMYGPVGMRDLRVSIRTRYDASGNPNNRSTYPPNMVETICGSTWVRLLDDETMVPVRPIRERCRHYKRMCVANDDQPDPTAFLHFIRFRNCMMRRSVGGAFLSLRDEAVYACDYRDPPDESSVRQHLDGPDEKKLSERPDLVKLPLFGLEGDMKVER